MVIYYWFMLKMFTELFILVPFFILYVVGFISLSTFFILLFVLYWLPKPIVINLLEWMYPSVLTRNISSKNIALTFDDMPYGSHKEIIGLLDKHNMQGTFFVISSQITEQNRKIFVDAVKTGHQLANHGRTNSMHYLKNESALRSEIMHCDNIIKEIYKEAGVPIPSKMIYRPGCGLFGPAMLRLLKSLDYILALGSVYPNDPMIRFGSVNYLYLINHIERGDIVILHDRPWTPLALENLLGWMQLNSIKSVTINKLFNFD